MRLSNRATGRFSLLLLDEGEYYFEDASAFYYPPGFDDQSTIKRKVKGRLHLCSGSLIFDPDDSKLAIIRLPFKNVEYVSTWKGSLCQLLPRVDLFVVRSRLTVRMKENNTNTPYIFKEDVEDHRFSLNYTSLDAYLPKIQRMLSISRKSQQSMGTELRDIIDEKESSTSFNTSALVDINERIIKETTAIRVTPLVNDPGRLLITNTYIYFQPFHNFAVEPVDKFKLETVVRVSKRRHVLRDVGIELFMDNSESDFFAFKSTELRDSIYSLLMSQESMSRATHGDDQQNMTLKWQNGVVSNYDYLIYLNSLAGRTTNDLTQYPVFPWVIADYISSSLDLNNPSTFRDLSKPIGALNPERLAMFQERMEHMPEPKFLYGTHYSTPGYVLYYLVREVSDFMLRLQNGKFDSPGRMFHSIAETWFGVLNNAADVKELIPEFYQRAGKGSFLINTERLNLGVRDNGQIIDDVVLPPWAKDAEDFVNKMAEALESDYVSENLHHWIDLIFGYKQQGPESVKANNVFYPLTYEGAVDIEKIIDPLEKEAIIAQIKEFGQTPKQLFNNSHPQRLPKDLRSSNPIPLDTATNEILLPLTAEPLDLSILKPLLNMWGPLSDLNYDFSIKLHKDAITSICISSDGTTLYSVSQDSSLKVYSLTEKRQLRSTNLCELALSSCQLTTDEKVVVAGSWDNNIYVYSVDYGSRLDTVAAHDDAVSCLCLRENILISGSWDATVKVWQFNGTSINKVPLADFSDHDTEVYCLDIDSQCAIAASGAADGTVVLYDLVTMSHIRTIDAHNEAVNSIQFTPDGSRLITCSSDGTLKMFEVSGTEIFSADIKESLQCLTTDGETLLLGGDDGCLRIWSLKTGAELRQLKGSTEKINCVVSSKTADVVVTGCANSIRVYKRSTEESTDD